VPTLGGAGGVVVRLVDQREQLLIERMVISGEGAALMETLVKADTTYGFLLHLLTTMLFRGILSLQF
jgi:hypothetical protein